MSFQVKRNGRRRNLQRYKCSECLHQFQSERRPAKFNEKLWKQYVWKKQNLSDLANENQHGPKWVRRRLDKIKATEQAVVPRKVVIIADTTFWGREYGVMVFRVPEETNIWWQEVERELMAHYHYGKKILEERGWVFAATVVDGRRGLTNVFKGIPVQVCQFHQMKTVTRYLTRKPETLAGMDLRAIMLQLPESNEKEFTELLEDWHKKYKTFINQKTIIIGCNRWYYTHKNVRSAYLSLKNNLPFLFTYQKYPELNIPNTTNSLDGMFTQLKARLAVHRGLRRDRRYKMISEILRGRRN